VASSQAGHGTAQVPAQWARPADGQQQRSEMMERQARRSGAVMGFDTHMVARSRACSTRPTHPTITNETSPHYAEALGATLMVSTIAEFHAGTFSKSARNANTSATGRRIVTVFSNDAMVAFVEAERS
jgi:hypothetical protein